MSTLLAIDPGRSAKGEATIGYAVFDKEFSSYRGQCTYGELTTMMEFLSTGSVVQIPRRDGSIAFTYVDEIVIEDFVNNDRSRGGQHNGTSECIGMVEFAAGLLGIPFTRQSPSVLSAAKLHAVKGSYKELAHLRHEDSAYLHGLEYLIRQGRMEVDLSDTM